MHRATLLCLVFVGASLLSSQAQDGDTKSDARKPLAGSRPIPTAMATKVVAGDDNFTISLKERYTVSVNVLHSTSILYTGGKWDHHLPQIYVAADRMIDAEKELPPSPERRIAMMRDWLDTAVAIERIVKDKFANNITQQADCDLAAYGVSHAKVLLLKAQKEAGAK